MAVESGCGCQGGGKRSSRKTARKGPSSAAKKLYRKRVKGSKCRGMMAAKCRHSNKCKMALGKKRSFCRKAGNTKRPRYNLRTRKTMKGGKGFIKSVKTQANNVGSFFKAAGKTNWTPQLSSNKNAKYGPVTI